MDNFHCIIYYSIEIQENILKIGFLPRALLCWLTFKPVSMKIGGVVGAWWLGG